MPIKLLDPKVVARIAAGEVVERPASVVKELVENALDAGASQITVEATGGGVSLLRVTDNGVGIPAGEAALAFQRYATSKVASLDDLQTIATLGFRGEALPSIAAVAEVDMVTCAQGEAAGSVLNVRDGNVVHQGSQGRSTGTTVTVRNLFHSLPARRKFLKSPATENGHIAHVVSQYALAYPEVKFTLSIDSRVVLRTPGSGQLIDSVSEVFGLEMARHMLPVDSRAGGWEGGTGAIIVTGMAGAPSLSRASRDFLSFFVNRRWVNSRLLAWAVEEAYHGLLMTGKHPVAVINISLPSADVDINIHPTKTEVKFQDEHAVFGAVQKAVRRALIETAPTAKIEEVATAYRGTASPVPTLWTTSKTEEHRVFTPPVASATPIFALPALRLLGQLDRSYIVAEGPDGLYLIDQHAAHERILFEKVQSQFAQQELEVQGLLEPATFEVNPREEEVLKTVGESLAKFGFCLEPFGERSYLVRTVPALLHEKDWAGALRELLDASSGSNDEWSEKIAASIACHSAVRAGQVLSDDEMRALVRQLEQAALPNTCPHGRPTMIHLSVAQLAREFQRT